MKFQNTIIDIYLFILLSNAGFIHAEKNKLKFQ